MLLVLMSWGLPPPGGGAGVQRGGGTTPRGSQVHVQHATVGGEGLGRRVIAVPGRCLLLVHVEQAVDLVGKRQLLCDGGEKQGGGGI